MTRAWALVSKSGKVITMPDKRRIMAAYNGWAWLAWHNWGWMDGIKYGHNHGFWEEANRRGWRIARVEIQEVKP